MLDLKQIFNSGESDALKLAQSYRDGKKVSAFGLCSFAKSVVTALASEGDKTLIVTGDFYLARSFYDKLSSVASSVVLLPARDDTLMYRDALSGENVSTRLKALYEIATGKAQYVVCPAEAITQIYPVRERYLDACLTFKKGNEYTIDEVVKKLTRAGYKRETQITDVGRFALRGDILDVWSVAESQPARIEFFGDEVESIRYVDSETHRSGEHTDSYDVAPVTEFFATDDECQNMIQKLNAETSGCKLAPDYASKMRETAGQLVMRLTAGDKGVAMSYLLPLCEHSTLYSFGAFDGVVYDETKQVFDNVNIHATEHKNRYTSLLARGETLSFTVEQFVSDDEIYSFSGKKLAFHNVMTANRIFAPDAVFSFKTMENPPYYKDYRALITDTLALDQKGYTIYLCADDETLTKSLTMALGEYEIGYNVGYGFGGIRIIKQFCERGCVFHSEKIAVIGTYDLKRKNDKKKLRRHKSEIFGAPEKGDYVVHELHGIGRFDGIVKLDVSGARHDYLLISYAGTDKLYVPIENMDSLSKYVADGGQPKLNKIGGADFAKVKDKVKKSVKELAINLVDLYGERMNSKGHVYSADDSIVDEFGASFEFSETEDQLTAIEEGLKDLKAGKIMDRLLCGDVGYGKTEVALRIAFKVIAEGKQVAFMSPTTILAKQHYETVVKRMEQFGVIVGRLTRFDSEQSQAKTISALKAGKMDIVVGTHRLLSKDVDFADLGLLILDEEQRFGVADKEKIKDLKRGVNVLTLSATPIPRTLHMSLVGIRDISVLDTPPVERIPVQTYVMEYGETLLVDACTREINRGGQVFIVYNRVSDIDRFAGRVQDLMPSAKVIYAHGQMREDTLEKRIEQFVAGKADILVSSTIVENGIDIARANTMIVMDADRLGLSQLYQLRGRVGRSNRLAYVFFTYDGRKTLTSTAYQRLDAITQFTEFGSGFKIAMRDLEIRGAGSVLGAQQHGHMEKVGYDMYCKLLSEAVGELRGESIKKKSEVRAVVDYPVFIPEGYVTDKEWRLRVYSRISKVASIKERENLLVDMKDIYGEVPDSVKNLIDVALIKNLASMQGASGVTLKRKETALVFDKVADIDGRIISIVNKHDGKVVADAKPHIKFPSGAKLLKFLLNCQKMQA